MSSRTMISRLALLGGIVLGPTGVRAGDASRPARREFLVAAHRALMHREAQPDFDYDSAEVRWLGASRSLAQWLVGGGVGRPRGEFGSYVAMAFAGLRCALPAAAYVQVDSGPLVTDANRVHDQRLIGNTLEFRSRVAAGIGLRPRWLRERTVFVEIDYEHISNAGLARRNLGADDFGAALGVTW